MSQGSIPADDEQDNKRNSGEPRRNPSSTGKFVSKETVAKKTLKRASDVLEPKVPLSKARESEADVKSLEP